MNRSWPLVSLGELIRLERRTVQVLPDQQYQEIGIYCFGKGIFHKLRRSGLEVGDKNLYEIREGDLILQVTFAWEGAIALCSRAETGLYGSTRYPTFRVNEERCFAPFLARYLITPDGLEQINKICPGSAGRNRVLSLKRIDEVKVPLPPLPEQRKIVARIEELTAKINEARALRQQAVKEAEMVLNAAMKTRFDFLGAPTTVADYAEVQGGYAFPSSEYDEFGTHQVVRIGNVRDGFLDLSRAPVRWTAGKDSRVLKYELNTGDLIISMTGTRNKRDYGFIAKVPPGEKLLLNQRVGRFVIHRELDRDYLFYFLRSPFFRDNLFPSATGTANQANVGNADIESVPFAAPQDVSEQRRIVAELDGLQAQMDTLKKLQDETAAELDALLPSILDRAFNGEL